MENVSPVVWFIVTIVDVIIPVDITPYVLGLVIDGAR